MPQLDTSTWFSTIIVMIMTLFILFQLKFSTYNYISSPEIKLINLTTHKNSWETKWTKIYLPLL
uniref:ATP synthase complex subunit 8 n=1 Tax=Echinosorex gymnura TaxID=162630 RepID=Q953L6_ECHGY|nr:ATP synthase F0 subunit 8 [Echinosorex gymnura]AAK64226.1 ATPase8 [Echinosorex gymnura]WIF29502.1 ATP synthase F0 subunit 8 [Echinosorex gymnura]